MTDLAKDSFDGRSIVSAILDETFKDNLRCTASQHPWAQFCECNLAETLSVWRIRPTIKSAFFVEIRARCNHSPFLILANLLSYLYEKGGEVVAPRHAAKGVVGRHGKAQARQGTEGCRNAGSRVCVIASCSQTTDSTAQPNGKAPARACLA